MSEMDNFFTRQKANEGIKLPLVTPDGETTEHFIMIRGIDSDAFREAETEARRSALQVAAIEDEVARNEAITAEKLTLMTSLVLDWSFDQTCSPDYIRNFLREAPQIADQIDQLAAKRSLFFAKELSNSPPSRKRNSGSTRSRKAQQ
ncbi:MAG: hypothetical protein ACR2PT_21870 [Endozoicomonas sp.]